jgi:hypothetical protein
MKKLIVLALVISIFSCNVSNENKAKTLVKDYLKNSLNDPKSYEEISWGKLDSSYSKIDLFSDEDYLRQLDRKADEISLNKYEPNRTLNDMSRDIAELKSIQKKADSVGKLIEYKKVNFKPQFERFKINHIYRAKNAMGGLIIQKNTFYIADDFSKVISMN